MVTRHKRKAFFFLNAQEMSAYKIAAMQQALEESVPISELERANKEFTELTAKYRDTLQRDSRLIQRTNNLEHLEVRRCQMNWLD